MTTHPLFLPPFELQPRLDLTNIWHFHNKPNKMGLNKPINKTMQYCKSRDNLCQDYAYRGYDIKKKTNY